MNIHKYTAQWFGGPSYACPYPDDVEYFDTLQAAKDALWSRDDFDPYYPCVEGSEMHIYRGHLESTEEASNCPDYVLTIGPRGGIRSARC